MDHIAGLGQGALPAGGCRQAALIQPDASVHTHILCRRSPTRRALSFLSSIEEKWHVFNAASHYAKRIALLQQDGAEHELALASASPRAMATARPRTPSSHSGALRSWVRTMRASVARARRSAQPRPLPPTAAPTADGGGSTIGVCPERRFLGMCAPWGHGYLPVYGEVLPPHMEFYALSSGCARGFSLWWSWRLTKSAVAHEVTRAWWS
jgi:hypothetical protein